MLPPSLPFYVSTFKARLLFHVPAILRVCVSLRRRVGEEGRGWRESISLYPHTLLSGSWTEMGVPRRPVQGALYLQPFMCFCPPRGWGDREGPSLARNCSSKSTLGREAGLQLQSQGGRGQLSWLSHSFPAHYLNLKSWNMCFSELVHKNVFCRILE